MASGRPEVAEVDSYSWERLPDMLHPRCYTTGAYHQGKLYVLGEFPQKPLAWLELSRLAALFAECPLSPDYLFPPSASVPCSWMRQGRGGNGPSRSLRLHDARVGASPQHTAQTSRLHHGRSPRQQDLPHRRR